MSSSSSALWITIILAVFCNQRVVFSYRILCVFPTVSRSHFLAFEGLPHGLAEAGHNVTLIGPTGVLEPINNLYHIETSMGPMHKKMKDELNANPGNPFNVFGAMLTAFEFGVKQTADIFTNTEVRRILSEDKFDLVILEGIFGESLLGLGSHFNCPIVIFTSFKANRGFLDLFNNPLGLSYVPNIFASFLAPMNFFERVHNMINYLVETPLYQMGRWKNEQAYNEYFPAPKYPSYLDAMKNISLLFVTQHFCSDGAQALFPNIIEVGGIHLSDRKLPIPNGLEKWMNESINGVVYLSFGTVFNITQIPNEKMLGILNALGKLKQNVLFKIDSGYLPTLPSNVRVEKWVPQMAVLQHQNTKLFITHAGLGSITEARFYAVPILSIPVGIDQFTNAMSAEKEGWGLVVPFKTVTGEILYNAMQDVLTKPQYMENVKTASQLYRDRPLSPVNTAIFWIEYVIRHRGAKFLVPHSTNLSFVQLHSIDVLGFLAGIVVIFIFLTCKCVRVSWSKCFGTTNNKEKLS